MGQSDRERNHSARSRVSVHNNERHHTCMHIWILCALSIDVSHIFSHVNRLIWFKYCCCIHYFFLLCFVFIGISIIGLNAEPSVGVDTFKRLDRARVYQILRIFPYFYVYFHFNSKWYWTFFQCFSVFFASKKVNGIFLRVKT